MNATTTADATTIPKAVSPLPAPTVSPASPSVVQAANLAHRRPNSEIAQIIRSVEEMRESVVQVREHQKYGSKRVSLVLEKVRDYSTEVASYSDEVDEYREEVDQYSQKVDESDKKIDKLSREVGKLIDMVNKVGQDVTVYNQNVDKLSQKVDKVLEMNTHLGLWFDGSNTRTVEPTALDMSAPNSNGEVIAIDDDEQGAGDSLESVEQDGTYSTQNFDDAIDGSGDYGGDDMVR